jgi:CTP:molybdopterin cytidylyltransferase MocA
MGRPKLALPLGNRSVIERVVSTLRNGGVERVVVVVGPHVPELIPLAQSAGADVVPLTATTDDMRATVTHGLDWIEQQLHPAPSDICLLVPGDSPILEDSVVRQLLGHTQQSPSPLLVPTYNGKRGHPVLFSWDHVAGFRSLPPGQGLNSYLRQCHDRVIELPQSSPAVLADLNTPEDYERLHSQNVRKR